MERLIRKDYTKSFTLIQKDITTIPNLWHLKYQNETDFPKLLLHKFTIMQHHHNTQETRTKTPQKAGGSKLMLILGPNNSHVDVFE